MDFGSGEATKKSKATEYVASDFVKVKNTLTI